MEIIVSNRQLSGISPVVQILLDIYNFRRGHYMKDFGEIILNLDQWFRKRCHSKIFLSKSLATVYFCQRSKTICANLAEDIIKNISMK